MSELKPCPFCGGKAEINAWAAEDYDDGDAMISCEKCEAKTSIYVSTEYAAEAWNRRTSDALEAENKALREDAKRIYWAGAKDMRELLAEKMSAFGKSVHTEALPEFPACVLSIPAQEVK